MRPILPILPLAVLFACGGVKLDEEVASEPAATAGPTADEAAAWVKTNDEKLKALYIARETAYWAYETDIKPETEALASSTAEAAMAYLTTAIPEAAAFNDVTGLDPDVARQLGLMKIQATLPAPSAAEKRKRLAEIATKLGGLYGKGKFCKTDDDCKDLGQLEEIIGTSRNPDELLEAWEGWRTLSPQMRPIYQEFVALGNEGATEIGYADMGVGWRSGYDMTPQEFEVEIDRLWAQVQPLYEQLHCHVRAELNEQYGDDVVATSGSIPAHLLGNMWRQSWDNLYPMLEPFPGEPSLDVTAALVDKGYEDQKMVKAAEGFFTSMGLDPLPQTFWENSMFTKPEGKEVVCHASAWDLSYNNDLRIKMCIKPTMEDYVTIHHELGHNYYFQNYYTLPVLYQSGANDGFHEAIGDAIALSITPSYLNKVGLLDTVSESEHAVINKQMQDALAKVAFLPFGRMIDQWRWDVFNGKISTEEYNKGWWELRAKYQGIAPPSERSEDLFDPGAKYHIPGNTPYIRYFLAHVLQFQFHKAMCEASGHEGPLHTCSVYESKEAGAKLKAMLEMGASKPWPDALEALTDTREMSADPLVEYFAPLAGYLAEQNKDRTCGWTE
ncbi:MAG: peptidase M2 family protein [Rhodobacterales bacterium]|nr:peptidase M2 family protein [Rhodobacterales bacterium]